MIKVAGLDSAIASQDEPNRGSQAPLSLESIQRHLDANIRGTAVPFSQDELDKLSNIAAIKKIYKFNTTSGRSRHTAGVNGARDGALADAHVREHKELETAALAMMALKGS